MNVLTTEKLLDYCDSDDYALQTEALLQLVDAEVYEAVPKILRLLKSSDELIRSHAAEALGYLGIEEVEIVGAALMPLLKDPEKLVRSETVEALGELGYTPAIAPIEHILRNDPSALVRASAAETLGYLEDPEAIKTLELSLLDADEDRAVRGYAANSIGLLGTSQLLPKLEKYLKLELPLPIKAELLGARYWLGAKEDIKQLLSLLDDADELLAIIILNILTDLKEREPEPNLDKDAPELDKVLSAIALRFPLMRHQAESILAD
ncbi:MAG: HEAT repeat domain-containing protein [Microcoleus sp. PH2017_10_PVI_O_A]|uniref:HEAT repeat domain-containing protein n=1 Tax=unclassified Microcoleus TaxID=2642155 RepID=UPI001E04A56A|nr:MULTISPECIES: HEAT repeat domain-containing protein [unclassified Microcoleus]TAE83890.1 MAG: HEAT repeat domain-containing protein [Oscillatoriales cyanobacterium]MCC3405764.1 HEAT repeat domain-containing protein [Microcoleus sp. PH2017_10_PVI_O_A]MCC3459722.1 HEAT repeat domain-containing protein [Microcoleus sp. PH2017_11_PCY_U_A]MCC3477772.1 HEAT repeat domain-containing protein [Microcoleus sp. PH2017_12_PCY_D_A]MCC3559084.1 HEAT repeat domain-containing protein [Microcoleus sp. PH201